MSADYNDNTIKVVYIGFRPVCSYQFNILQISEDSPITLKIVSAPSMDDSVSYSVMFVQMSEQLKDKEIVMVDKRLSSFEEYEKYPGIPE